MSQPIARINEYRDAVVGQIERILPELRECKAQFGRFNLEELETTSIRTPAVRFGVLSAKGKSVANGGSEATLNCAAFIITEGNTRDRDAWAISEAILVSLHSGQMFGMVQLGVPSDVSVLPVVTGKLKSKAVSIIAVEWKQELRQLGATIFDDVGRVISELYINDELTEVDGDA